MWAFKLYSLRILELASLFQWNCQCESFLWNQEMWMWFDWRKLPMIPRKMIRMGRKAKLNITPRRRRREEGKRGKFREISTFSFSTLTLTTSSMEPILTSSMKPNDFAQRLLYLIKMFAIVQEEGRSQEEGKACVHGSIPGSLSIVARLVPLLVGEI